MNNNNLLHHDLYNTYKNNQINYFDYNSHADFISALERKLPDYFSRQEAAKILGGLISAKTMSNADAAGQGVEVKVRIANKVAYEKHSFIKWISQKLR